MQVVCSVLFLTDLKKQKGDNYTAFAKVVIFVPYI